MAEKRYEEYPEFITWLEGETDRTYNKFLLAKYSRLNHETKKPILEYKFEVAGTGSTWHRRRTVVIPVRVGMVLENLWKRNEYKRFVGVRGAKSIFKLLDDSPPSGWNEAREDHKNHTDKVERRKKAKAQHNNLVELEMLIKKINTTFADMDAGINAGHNLDIEGCYIALKNYSPGWDKEIA